MELGIDGEKLTDTEVDHSSLNHTQLLESTVFESSSVLDLGTDLVYIHENVIHSRQSLCLKLAQPFEPQKKGKDDDAKGLKQSAGSNKVTILNGTTTWTPQDANATMVTSAYPITNPIMKSNIILSHEKPENCFSNDHADGTHTDVARMMAKIGDEKRHDLGKKSQGRSGNMEGRQRPRGLALGAIVGKKIKKKDSRRLKQRFNASKVPPGALSHLSQLYEKNMTMDDAKNFIGGDVNMLLESDDQDKYANTLPNPSGHPDDNANLESGFSKRDKQCEQPLQKFREHAIADDALKAPATNSHHQFLQKASFPRFSRFDTPGARMCLRSGKILENLNTKKVRKHTAEKEVKERQESDKENEFEDAAHFKFYAPMEAIKRSQTNLKRRLRVQLKKAKTQKEAAEIRKNLTEVISYATADYPIYKKPRKKRRLRKERKEIRKLKRERASATANAATPAKVAEYDKKIHNLEVDISLHSMTSRLLSLDIGQPREE